MNTKDILKALIEHGYSEKQAMHTAQELMELSESLKTLLARWMEQNEESDYAAEGFTLLELKQKFEMTYPAALLTIDWLLKEPDMAKKAIATGGK